MINYSRLCLFGFFLVACSTQSQKIEILASLPSKIKEASACEIVKGSDLVWTVEDSNNAPVLFGLSKEGKLVRKIKVTNVKNHDWEDLTSDEQGNLYIGDFGNNDNDRTNLAIYKINAADLSKDEVQASEVIEFYYPEQEDFPPKKKDRVYDVESFFIHNNTFYLFTKNRSSRFDGTTTLYKVANTSGQKLPAKKISSFVTCDNFNHCAVTSAAISPDKKKVAILTADKVWIFKDFKGDDFFSGNSERIELEHFSQKEGLCFEDNSSILMTDEAKRNGKSFLYRLKLK